MIDAPDPEIAEPALGLLRNVVCTYDEDSEPAFGLAGMGEQRMLSSLCTRLLGDKEEKILLSVSSPVFRQWCAVPAPDLAS